MALSSIFRHVATHGNRALVAKGTPLFTKAGRKNIHYNVVPGQLVAYFTNNKGTIPKAIEAADITAENVHRLRIDMGFGSGPTSTDLIPVLSPHGQGNCELEHASVASPRCGSPMVVDYYFKCVTCYDNYNLAVGIDDNFTRSYSPLQKSVMQFFGSYQPECATCDGCDTPVTCDEIVTGIVKNIRAEDAPTVQGTPYPDYKHPDVELPFEITKLYDRSLVYCLQFTDPANKCEDCDMVSAITEVTIGGTAYTLSGTTLPDDATQTARIQLDSVVDQINGLIDEHLDGKGSAYITGVGPSNCCPIQLHVNIEDPAFAITGLTPNKDVNPFDAGEPGEGNTCGIRVIAAPLTGECGCFLDKEAATYSRIVSINGHDGFVDGRQVVIQQMEMPGQFGLQIQHRQMQQTIGGEGRTYARTYSAATYSGAPRQDSWIVNAPTADCKEDYCSFYARSRFRFDNPGNDLREHRKADSFVYVPSGDDVTIAAVTGLFSKWAEISKVCEADSPTLVCSPLQTTCA